MATTTPTEKAGKYVYERFPEARFEIIPACGHTPWKHNPATFVKLLKDFYSI